MNPKYTTPHDRATAERWRRLNQILDAALWGLVVGLLLMSARCACAQSVWVNFSNLGNQGTPITKTLTITPAAGTMLQTDGSNTIYLASMTLPASTNMATNLWVGLYSVSAQGVPKAWLINVTTNFGLGVPTPIPAVWFSTNLQWAGTNYANVVSRLVAGTGIALSPTNGQGAVTVGVAPNTFDTNGAAAAVAAALTNTSPVGSVVNFGANPAPYGAALRANTNGGYRLDMPEEGGNANGRHYPRLWKAMYRGTNAVRILADGDSMSDWGTGGLTWGMISLLTNSFPIVGMAGNGNSGYPWWGFTTNFASPAAWLFDPDSYWWKDHLILTNAATAQFGPGAGASSPIYASRITVPYISEPNAGAFLVQTSANNVAWSTFAAINASGSGTNLLFTNIVCNPASGIYLRFVGSGGGTLGRVVTLLPWWVNDVSPGSFWQLNTSAGNSFANWFSVSTNITTPYLQALNPDLVVVSEINGGISTSNIYSQLYTQLTNACTNADVVFTGMLMEPTNSDYYAADWQKNAMVRDFAISVGRPFWDRSTLSGLSREELAALGWAGSGPHIIGDQPYPPNDGGMYLGQLLMNDIARTVGGALNYNAMRPGYSGVVSHTNTANVFAGKWYSPLTIQDLGDNGVVTIGNLAGSVDAITFNPPMASGTWSYLGSPDYTGINAPSGGNQWGTIFSFGGSGNPLIRFYYSGGGAWGSGVGDPGAGGLAASGVIQATPGGRFAGSGSGLTNLSLVSATGTLTNQLNIYDGSGRFLQWLGGGLVITNTNTTSFKAFLAGSEYSGTNGATNITINGPNGAITNVGPMVAASFTGSGSGLTNVPWTPSKTMLLAAVAGGNFQRITSIVDTNVGTITNSLILWPDATYGTWACSNYNTTWFTVDGYTVTYTNTGETISQATVTRNNFGVVTNRPALTITP